MMKKMFNEMMKIKNIFSLIIIILACVTIVFADIIPVSDCNQLQAIDHDCPYDCSGSYELTKNIDCSDTINWNGGLGFDPIGSTGSLWAPFTGTFDGKGFNITGLYINRPLKDYVGLFAADIGTAVIRNVGLINVNITGQRYVGGLIGHNLNGSVTNSYSTGAITGNRQVGGLIGYNTNGSVINCHAEGSVACTGDDVGGLIGRNDGYNKTNPNLINNSYAYSNVTGSQNTGGLIGYNFQGFVDQSYSSGTVNGEWSVGGLIGTNSVDSSIIDSYSSSTVNGGGDVGGLIGFSSGTYVGGSYATGNVTSIGGHVGGLIGGTEIGSTTVTECYAEGSVTGGAYVGGLIGDHLGAPVNNCYATGNVTGTSYYLVGGLIGENFAQIADCYATGTVTSFYSPGGGSQNYGPQVGGLVGGNLLYASITNCYATGTVTFNGIPPKYGPLTVGGLIGFNDYGGSITNSYWDVCRTTQSRCCGYDLSYSCSENCYNKNNATNKNTTYFYMKTNPPMDAWSNSVWKKTNCDGAYPVLFNPTGSCNTNYDPCCNSNCDNKECGNDGCDGSCGTCAQGQTCMDGLCKSGEDQKDTIPEIGANNPLLTGAVILIVALAIGIVLFKKR